MLEILGRYALPAGAAVLAGAVNAIAGGGSLLTFPALLSVGVPPIVANATNTVALVPGSASALVTYRRAIAADAPALVAMTVPSVLGGVAGALLVLRAGDPLFARLVPWLILGATALFIGQAPLAAWVKRRGGDTAEDGPAGLTPARLVTMGAMQLAIATYGGFFGAGMGIMMLAGLGLVGVRGIHRMNGLKNFAAIAINGVAAVTFIARGKVDWGLVLVMAGCAVVGGYAGGHAAQRASARAVRVAIVIIGLTIAAVMFARQLAA